MKCNCGGEFIKTLYGIEPEKTTIEEGKFWGRMLEKTYICENGHSKHIKEFVLYQ